MVISGKKFRKVKVELGTLHQPKNVTKFDGRAFKDSMAIFNISQMATGGLF